MYCRLGRRGVVEYPAGAHFRLDRDTASCRADAVLRRYERAAAEAIRRGRAGLREIGPELLDRIADTSNLYAAWGHLKLRGGQAPGPNGLRYEDLNQSEVHNLLRTINSAIRSDTHRHGPTRKVPISKSSGVGSRTLSLENIEDRTVARAVVQVIQPLLDPMFNDNSFGYRPGRSREHALIRALQLTAAGNMFWVVEDVKNAFDVVPLNRLLDVVRLRLPCAAATWQLIERIVRRGMKRGLRQGNCLSPLLLNLYLDHCLDRRWSKEASGLIRYADDLLIICRTEQEALEAYDRLQRLLLPAGLQLKGTPETAIRNLSRGGTVEWSGYEISTSAAGFQIRIGTKSWNHLAQSLEEAHTHPGSPLYAGSILDGWIDAQGATHADEDQELVVRRVDEICRKLALEEACREEHLLGRWRAAYARWCRIRQNCFGTTGVGTPGTSSGGSACHLFSDGNEDSRCDGASRGAPSLLFPTANSIALYTDGCCDAACHDGAWAAVIEADRETETRSGYLQRTTNNRAELLAVIRGLELLPESAEIRLVTDSQYVALGITDRLEIWKHQGWRTGRAGRRKDLKNADLWQRLDALLLSRRVTCDWVRGHAGHRQNEHADALAEIALNRGRRQRAAAS